MEDGDGKLTEGAIWDGRLVMRRQQTGDEGLVGPEMNV